MLYAALICVTLYLRTTFTKAAADSRHIRSDVIYITDIDYKHHTYRGGTLKTQHRGVRLYIAHFLSDS